MIQLIQVTRQYHRRGETVTAFQCDQLSIGKGEYVAVVGPSGSGKTTLLSLLGGMLSPTAGEVLLNGQSLYKLPPAARSALRSECMGFVFQTFNLIPYLTALQNVQIPLCLSGMPIAEQIERATALLVQFGLAERVHHRPAELSVGQQQRVALARTLVNDPQVILADEPTGNLDPESREMVLTAFEKCHHDGRTLVMVTHDPVAATRAQRRLLLRNGQLGEVEAAAESDSSHKAA
jgi:putative ABC transport system ATP-binding protein